VVLVTCLTGPLVVSSRMPKTKKGSKGRLSLRPDRPIRYVGRYFTTVATAGTVLAINLNPLNLDPRLIQISDVYQNFRFEHIRVRAWSAYKATSPAVSALQVSYNPTLPTTAITPTFMPFEPLYAIGDGTFGNKWPHVVAKSELHQNQPRWFRRGTGYDDLSENQGQVIVGWSDGIAFSTGSASILLEYVVMLAGNIDAAFTVSGRLPDHEQKGEASNHSDASGATDMGFVLEPDPLAELKKEVRGLQALLSVAPSRPP